MPGLNYQNLSVTETPDYINLSTNLPDFVKNNEEILVKEVVFGSDTISRITPQVGIKTSAAINFLSAAPVFQNGKGCGFTPINTATLTQRTIVTGLIKVNEEVCPDTLLGYWPEYLVHIPADTREGGDFPFEEYLVRAITDSIKKDLEKAIWQGNTTSSDTQLKWFDGFLKIVANEESHVAVSIAAGSSAFDAIKAVWLALPEIILDKNPLAFVSPALFRQFMAELVEKNYYHYSGAQAEAPKSFIFPGTNLEVIPTPGLAGTLKIFASVRENMYYGTDVVDAKERFQIDYLEKEEVYAVKVRWNSGVQVAFPDWCVIGTLASTPVSPASTAATLADIAASAGKVSDVLEDVHDTTKHSLNSTAVE